MFRRDGAPLNTGPATLCHCREGAAVFFLVTRWRRIAVVMSVVTAAEKPLSDSRFFSVPDVADDAVR